MDAQILPEEQKTQIDRLLAASPLIPVISITDPKHIEPLGDALVGGGLHVLEITLRTSHGLPAIEKLAKRYPDVWVGAGTVMSVDQYREAESAGAQFVITPGSTRALLEHGTQAPIPLLPGVATLSEIMEGYRLGYRAFKFFPAEVAGGIAALKAFAGPVEEVVFCPTGGIRPETAADYLALDNVPAVGGTWLTPQHLLQAEDWEAIRAGVQDSLKSLSS